MVNPAVLAALLLVYVAASKDQHFISYVI